MTLQISSANPVVVNLANRYLSPYGFDVISMGGAGTSSGIGAGVAGAKRRVKDANQEIYPEPPQVADGAALGVMLMQGDLILSGTGTITFVHGDRLVAFGHPMFAGGAVDYPMSTAVIFGILPSIMRPFKLGEVFEEIGSVRQDRLPAIGGQMGYVTPKMPMAVRIHAPDMKEGTREFHYEIVPDPYYGPYFAMVGWSEAVMSADRGGGPMTVDSFLRVRLADGRSLERRDFLSGDSMPVLATGYPLQEYIGNLLNNPYQTVKIESIEIDATIRQRLDLGVILDAELDRDVYRPGETASLRVWVQRWKKEIEDLSVPIPIPTDLDEGMYQVQLLDGAGRERLEYQLHPYLLQPLNIDDLIDSMQFSYPSNGLYAVLLREGDGMSLGSNSLPDLPGSVASAMALSAPGFKTQPLSIELLGETTRFFSYEMGGRRSFPLVVSRKVLD
jgi:hypothetical protein